MAVSYDSAAARFGRVLHKQRRLTGITQETLGRAIGVSSSHMSNIERGEKRPSPRMVAAMDRELGTEGRLETLWDSLSANGNPAWLTTLEELERGASVILDWQLALIPGLLQTEDYARTVITASDVWATSAEVNADLETRLDRGRKFVEAGSASLWAVVGEHAVRGCVGSKAIMQEQLRHVVKLVESGRAKLLVVPSSTTHHPGLAGSFKIISTDGAPDVLYADSVEAGQIMDDPATVSRYRLRFGALQSVAFSPERSLDLIKEELEGMHDDS